jgi:hypothetical protein
MEPSLGQREEPLLHWRLPAALGVAVRAFRNDQVGILFALVLGAIGFLIVTALGSMLVTPRWRPHSDPGPCKP